MLSFENTNIMSLIGICIEGEMPLLIMPFLANGSVLEFVKHHKEELLCSSADQQWSGNEEKAPIRWIAQESIKEDIYTEATDVVSKQFPMHSRMCEDCIHCSY